MRILYLRSLDIQGLKPVSLHRYFPCDVFFCTENLLKDLHTFVVFLVRSVAPIDKDLGLFCLWVYIW